MHIWEKPCNVHVSGPQSPHLMSFLSFPFFKFQFSFSVFFLDGKYTIVYMCHIFFSFFWQCTCRLISVLTNLTLVKRILEEGILIEKILPLY